MVSKARLKYLRSLHQKKVRAREGVLLVEGGNVVREAVACGLADEVYLTAEAGERMPDIAAESIEEREAEALAQTKTPAGAFAVVKDPCGPFEPALLPDRALVLLAAGVADPGNLGTLIRTAAALGFDAVVTTAGSVEPGNAKVVRATAGALFRLPVRYGEAADLREAGFSIWAADVGGTPIGDVAALPGRCALAVGNEPHGLPDDVLALCSERVSVPIRGGVESLNVAVAAGILMHGLRELVERAAHR